ncbi:hypothetical protein [Mycobacterium colombiense]
MSTWTLLALFLFVGLITALCWRYPLYLAKMVRSGELDEHVEASGY